MSTKNTHYISPAALQRMHNPIEASPAAIDLADLLTADDVMEQTGIPVAEVKRIAQRRGLGIGSRKYRCYSREDVRRIREAIR